jgi:hypothetical protein
MTDQPEELSTVLVLYVGRRELSAKGKTGEAYMTLNHFERFNGSPEQHHWSAFDKQTSLFPPTRKAQSPAIVGGIYEIPATLNDDGRLSTAVTGKRKFVRMIINEQWRTLLNARDEANAANIKVERQLNTLKADKRIDRELARLRMYWAGLHPTERAAFELAVLRRLRNP